MKSLGLRALAASLLLAACSAAGAFVPQNPGLDWRTLETPHFRIHFHGDEALAQLAAGIVERVHAELAPRLNWEPRAKTEVVLADVHDFPNGLATPYPYNFMLLLTSPPEPGDFLHAEDRAQWLETLITHEYAHVLHLDRARGAPLGLRRVFGRHVFTFPNAFQPTWLIEGLATHAETDHTHGVGRGQSSEFEMIMRTEVRAGLRPLSQVNVPNVSWPAGTVPYLYGVHFYAFLEEHYGAERVQGYIESYSGNLIPYRLNSTARRVFGKDLRVLWREYEDWLRARYTPQLEAIRTQGVVQGEALTAGGYAARGAGGNLQALADGTVYFVHADGRRRPALVRRDPQGHEARLTVLNAGARFRVHADGAVVIAQPEVCREYHIYYDLYLLAPGARTPERLTHCARYRDAAWSPDGRSLIAVRIADGRSELHHLNARGELQSVLARGAEGELYAQPDWSPDGTRVLLSRSARDAGGDLYEFEIATQTWHRLTDAGHYPIHPRYTRDGRAVLFTSDHGGVYNLRRLDLATASVHTLSRVETGAFQPSEGAPGEYYYLGYGTQGYDLHLLRAAPTLATPAARERPAARPELAAADTRAVRPYTPWSALRPRLWFPYLLLDEDVQEVGAFTFGLDPLGIHFYAVQPVIDISNGDLLGSLAYAYSDRWFLSLARYSDIERDSDDQLRRVRRTQEAALAYRVPHTRLRQSWNLYLGGAHERASDVEQGAGVAPLPTLRDTLAGAALHYRSSHTARLSVSEQEGRRVRLVAERSVADSDFEGNVYTADWREYLHLGGTHVLALRAVQGWGGDAPRPFTLGGARSDGFNIVGLQSATTTFNQRDYSLRGYARGTPALRGRRMQLASLEYRFPLALVERGAMVPPLGIQRWSGTLFTEAGAAWDEERPGRLHPAAGAEAVLDLTAGYHLGLRLRIGYAHGFDSDAGGGNRVYAALGGAF